MARDARLSILTAQEVDELYRPPRFDTDRFLATTLHDDSLIFVVDGQVIRGFDGLHEQQLKWWNNSKSDVIYTELAPPDEVSLGTTAVLATEQLASQRTMPDGKPREDRLVVTTIWRRLPIGWRVIYCHESHAGIRTR